jgi:FAD:protein FMN transferase
MLDIKLRQHQDHWIGTFQAMASPCTIIIDSHDKQLAQTLSQLAQKEALRIQDKFSRYQSGNIVWNINQAAGEPITVDRETAYLLDFADQCFQLSDGYFDITSGCLRRAWQFDGTANIPSSHAVAALMPFVGWKKIHCINHCCIYPKEWKLILAALVKNMRWTVSYNY